MNTEAICLLFGITVYLSQASLPGEWEEWKLSYGKVYTSDMEEMYRRQIWEDKLNLVNNHNNYPGNMFTLHMNEFADKEPRNRPSIREVDESLGNVNSVYSGPEIRPPPSFDWRNKGVIGPVINQGIVSDVQAIVAAEAVASLHAIQHGSLYQLSADEIIQCGCGQTEPQSKRDVFGCINQKIGGLCTNATYDSRLGRCARKECAIAARVTGTLFITVENEDEMISTIPTSPLMVYIDASRPTFELYQSGVYSDTTCSNFEVDHALQIVGYGEMNGLLYWICKNSWGVNWGSQGYILIERGTNMCGIATAAIYPF